MALTVNVLVKHPRSGLPLAVLYNLSYYNYNYNICIAYAVKLYVLSIWFQIS